MKERRKYTKQEITDNWKELKTYLNNNRLQIDYAIKRIPLFKKRWHEFLHKKFNQVK